MKSMRLYLDIDGVLNDNFSGKERYKPQEYFSRTITYMVDMICMENVDWFAELLKQLRKHYTLHLTIHSSWRQCFSLSSLAELLDYLKLGQYFQTVDTTALGYEKERVENIKEHMLQNVHDEYLVFDDEFAEPMQIAFGNRFIKTDFHTGFSSEEYSKVMSVIKLSTKVFTISDHHFNHKRILQYEENYRPFETVEEMHNFYIEQWNSVVGKDDYVIHCGDIAFFSRDSNPLEQLNGNIILVKGNHDRETTTKYKKMGVKEVFTTLEIEDFIFTHRPVQELPSNTINIHGHLHSKTTKGEGLTHCNVSVELLNGVPLMLPITTDILQQILDEKRNV